MSDSFVLIGALSLVLFCSLRFVMRQFFASVGGGTVLAGRPLFVSNGQCDRVEGRQ